MQQALGAHLQGKGGRLGGGTTDTEARGPSSTPVPLQGPSVLTPGFSSTSFEPRP